MFFYAIQGITFGLTGAVLPGPFQTYLILQSLKQGWQRVLPAALAPILSDCPIVVLALFVLSNIPSSLECGLHFASGIFILFLSLNSIIKQKKVSTDLTEPENRGKKTLLNAIFMNILSPGPYLFWSLVAGPVFLESWRKAPFYGISFLACFYGAMVLTLCMLIILIGCTKKLGKGVHKILLFMSMTALTCFGIYQLYQGFQLFNYISSNHCK